MRFIDLFAGLGGFHIALSNLGHECVMASEIDAELSKLYTKNFGVEPVGDIREIDLCEIPRHDILCAGFPCQPFSKAGDQKGFECPQWGDLIDYVILILTYRKPDLFIAENVPNLIRHNGGKTWANIKARMENAGYEVEGHTLSPHMFGIPQIRARTFIVGRYGGLNDFSWPTPDEASKLSIRTILDKCPMDARPLTDSFIEYLQAWQAFLQLFAER